MFEGFDANYQKNTNCVQVKYRNKFTDYFKYEQSGYGRKALEQEI